MAKIVLTGANGGIGSAVLKHILPLVSPSSLVLALHNPDAAPKSLKELGARVCKADYTEPQTLDDAFQGAGVLFLLSYPSIQHQERFQMHKNAIDAAVRQGVRHVFYTSLAFGGNLESSSRAFVMQAHLSTEAYLASLAASPSHPLTYTAIREGLYSESYPLYLGFFDPSHPVGEVALPDDGNRGIAWAARYELGEATAKLIHSYAHDSTTFPYINETILLSGPEALPLSGVVEVLGRLLGRPPIRIRRTSVDEYVTKYATLGAKDRDIAQNIKEWTTVYEAIKAGECEVVTPTLEEWLGREPETFEQTIGKMIQQQNKER